MLSQRTDQSIDVRGRFRIRVPGPDLSRGGSNELHLGSSRRNRKLGALPVSHMPGNQRGTFRAPGFHSPGPRAHEQATVGGG